MAWTEQLQRLNEELSYLVPDSRSIRPYLAISGISESQINLSGSAINVWFDILDYANKIDKVDNLVKAVLKDFPNRTELKNAIGNETPITEASILDETIWAPAVNTEQYEKILGETNDFLHVNFLERGADVANSVAQIKVPDGYGTGFLTTDNLLVTNNHVIQSAEIADKASVRFNFQKTISGVDKEIVPFELDSKKGFATSPKTENDWTVIRIKGNPNADFGAIPLNNADVKIKEHVNIIQHPYGGPKRLSVQNNLVVSVDTETQRVSYMTDTDRGSSGAPVFNNDWDLVALHSRASAQPEQGTSRKVWRNVGIHINAVVDGVQKANLM